MAETLLNSVNYQLFGPSSQSHLRLKWDNKYLTVLCSRCIVFFNSVVKEDWEMLQNDRIWICVYTVQYVTETLKFCRINLAKLQRWQHMMNQWESAWRKCKTCCVWHWKLSSVNSVTSIALHGAPHWCVSATEAGNHNRNLIQPFYSHKETRCVPSNNRHCLNTHGLL